MKTIFILLLISPIFASAKIKDIKEIRLAKQNLDEMAKTMHKKCGGSTKLNFNHEIVAKLKLEDRTSDNLIATAGSICLDYVRQLTNTCEDEDYKAEIAKLKEVTCTPNEKLSNQPRMIVTVKDQKMSIQFHPTIYENDSIEILRSTF